MPSCAPLRWQSWLMRWMRREQPNQFAADLSPAGKGARVQPLPARHHFWRWGMTVTLPYPAKALWPNGRAHWATKAREAKKLRQEAWAAALPVRDSFRHCDGLVAVHIICHPKARGPAPDRDAIVSAAKSALDGLSDALGINDRHFAAPTVEVSGERTGQFIITVGNQNGR